MLVLLLSVGIFILVISVFGARTNESVYRNRMILRLVGVAIIVGGFFTTAIRQIEPGEVGVQVLFGNLQDNVLNQGLNVVNPFINLELYSIRTQSYSMADQVGNNMNSDEGAIGVLSSDGLEVKIDLTVLYSVIPSSAPSIFKTYGFNIEDRFIVPKTRTRIRENAVNYTAVELFSTGRKEFQTSVINGLASDFSEKGILLEDVLVRNIGLPQSVKESIERKITADQESQRMEFVLDKGRREAELKRVEAQGVADAQRILSSGLSEKVLQYEMIKVQKELVASPNSKIIMLGPGQSAPPIFLNK